MYMEDLMLNNHLVFGYTVFLCVIKEKRGERRQNLSRYQSSRRNSYLPLRSPIARLSGHLQQIIDRIEPPENELKIECL